ncbi:hypothetical protein [Pelagovum pacificum]|uniref:Uncharacterized protein n=1 Tax=Pelagovum pacificum TaxID=2588711 RepID=A0A5C5GFZ0_9RHOB|nr:hypothetical protein [Pelagovum pacificum]QQA44010.1 hypothetical protein I8N54_05380 [Pelagovum pacificum]TNY32861.1 hypothetical protein FHY64_06180 [Pelagovum pacificum]
MILILLALVYVVGLNFMTVGDVAAPAIPEAAPEGQESDRPLDFDIGAGSGDDAAPVPEDQTPTGQFTTATEVRQILEMTKPQWIAVREYDGRDLLYFTQLLSWRCGLWDITYSVNGGPDEVFPMEPCHEGTATPNALTQVEDFLPYATLPLGSVESVSVTITYDDGGTDSASYERPQVLMP